MTKLILAISLLFQANLMANESIIEKYQANFEIKSLATTAVKKFNATNAIRVAMTGNDQADKFVCIRELSKEIISNVLPEGITAENTEEVEMAEDKFSVFVNYKFGENTYQLRVNMDAFLDIDPSMPSAAIECSLGNSVLEPAAEVQLKNEHAAILSTVEQVK